MTEKREPDYIERAVLFVLILIMGAVLYSNERRIDHLRRDVDRLEKQVEAGGQSR